MEADAEGIDEGDNSDGITDQNSLRASISSVAGYVFTAVWGANYTELPGYPTATQTPSPTKTPIADGYDLRVLPIGEYVSPFIVQTRSDSLSGKILSSPPPTFAILIDFCLTIQ